MNNRPASGPEFLRDENSTSIEEVKYSLRRAAEKVTEQNKEDYKDFLYEKFGVDEEEGILVPNPERANPDAEFDTSDEYGRRIKYHERMFEIAEERGVDLPDLYIDFQPEESEHYDYTPEHPEKVRHDAIDEFIHEMPSGFTMAMNMSKFR